MTTWAIVANGLPPGGLNRYILEPTIKMTTAMIITIAGIPNPQPKPTLS